MIRLTFSGAISLYIFLSVLGVLLVWLFFERLRPLRDFSFTKRHFWQCTICTTPYVDSLSDDISRCPHCGSLNSRR